MQRFVSPRPLFASLFAAVMLTIAGCSAGTISGPDLATSETVTQAQKAPSEAPSAPRNDGKDAHKDGGGTSTTQHAGRN